MRFRLTNSSLFYKKLLTLSIATIALIPLIHYKLTLPASMYLGALLILHLYIFYVYFSGVPWRVFLENKKELIARITAIAFFIYLLTVLSFTGSATAILGNLAGAFGLHVMILLLMMIQRDASEEGA